MVVPRCQSHHLPRRSFCLAISPASLSHSEWQTYPLAYQLASSICCYKEMAEQSLTMTSTSLLSTFRCIPSDPIDLCASSLLNSSQTSTLDNLCIPESAIKVMSQEGPSAELICEDRSKGRIEFLSLFPCPVSLEPLPPDTAGLHSPESSFYCHCTHTGSPYSLHPSPDPILTEVALPTPILHTPDLCKGSFNLPPPSLPFLFPSELSWKFPVQPHSFLPHVPDLPRRDCHQRSTSSPAFQGSHVV